MLRRGVAVAVPVVVVLLLSMVSQVANANGTSVVKASVELISAGSLGGQKVPAGMYSVFADDAKITFKKEGKMVAEAAIQWKDGAVKSDQNNLVFEGSAIKEIHFKGQTRYAVVTE